ncbi:hypothetical protein F4808DRAFT_452322 [Astrocystis sublimbata]|nr:hypothetical protein F4808DRAFT_452322 [Astrocystis sublimbata]
MPITAAASAMFDGITGVYGIVFSLAAAIASFAGPILGPRIPNDVATIILTLASVLAYIICTLPHPLSNMSGKNKSGPVVGTALAGFVYAFGTQHYLSVAAFFPSEAVVALSTGSGLSIVFGTGIYIALVNKAFVQDWRRCFLVIAPTALSMPIIWWFVFDKAGRRAAELSRRQSLQRYRQSASSDTVERPDVEKVSANAANDSDERAPSQVSRPGFGPNKTRVGLFFQTILPRYILPLIICTSCAILCLFGLAPALQTLNRFPDAPAGYLEFELIFFAYGSAQFLFSALVAVKPVPIIWIWTGVEVTLTTIILIQIWYPFIHYFWIWWVLMFFVGGCVGGSVTNTNYKISKEFKEAGEPDEVRSFANRFAGLGNFGGDAIGGAIGLVIQLVVVTKLTPTPDSG